MSNKYFDFILEDACDRKLKLRFDTERSSLHLFDVALRKDEEERTFQDIYKTYYSWRIMASENNGERHMENGIVVRNDEWTAYHDVFVFNTDENSMLSNLGELTKWSAHNKENILGIKSLGWPGSDWHIIYHRGFSYADYIRNEKEYFGSKNYTPDMTEKEFMNSVMYVPERLEYIVVRNTDGMGFKFNMTVERAKKFAEFIQEINNFMLAKGEAI